MKGYSLHHSQIEFILTHVPGNYNGLFKFLRSAPAPPPTGFQFREKAARTGGSAGMIDSSFFIIVSLALC